MKKQTKVDGWMDVVEERCVRMRLAGVVEASLLYEETMLIFVFVVVVVVIA